MNYADKKNIIEDLRRELDNLKEEFGKIEPLTDWVKIQIEPLVSRVVEPMILLMDREVHIKEELIDSYIKYVKNHIDGLKLVLRAEQDSFHARRENG